MIAIKAFSGVLTHIPEVLTGLAGLQQTSPARENKTTSPCGVYACQAMAGLGPLPQQTGLVCLSGATGATVKAFDTAWQKSEDGTLTGPDFTRRSKRIHPFTLVRSLQNQVPAVVSMEFGLKGPCINALDAATALADLLPNIEMMLNRGHQVVLVLAAAGGREEELCKVKHLSPKAICIEGALCFLLTQDGSLGYLETITSSNEPPMLQPPATSAPTLAGGLALLQCMAQHLTRTRIVLEDFSGYRTFFDWRNI